MYPGDGSRLPGEIGTQRTALLPQTVRTSFTTNGTRDLVLTRDSVFPLWGEQQNPAGIECYQMTWMGDEKLSTTGYAAAEFIQLDCAELAKVSVGPQAASPAAIQNAYTFPAAYPAAIFPEVDRNPYLWVPVGSQQVVGISFDSTFTAGSAIRANVTFQATLAPSYPLGEVTATTFNMGATAGAAAKTFDFLAGIPTGTKGIWVRCMRVDFETTAGTAFNATYKPIVTVAVVTATGVLTIAAATAAKDVPAVSGGANSTTFKPLIALGNARSQLTGSALLIARANRVVGTALEITNTTQMLNIDGYFACVTYPEKGNNTLAAPPTDSQYSVMLSSDKFNTRMANNLYTFVKPGRELSQFQDSMVEFIGYQGTALVPVGLEVINLYPVANYNLIRCVDVDAATTTQLLLTFKTVIEFVTNDILLRPQYPVGTIIDTQMAVNAIRNITPFWVSREGQTHRIVDRSSLTAPRASGPKKPKPRAAKPRARSASAASRRKATVQNNRKGPSRKSGLQMFLDSKPQTRGHGVRS